MKMVEEREQMEMFHWAFQSIKRQKILIEEFERESENKKR